MNKPTIDDWKAAVALVAETGVALERMSESQAGRRRRIELLLNRLNDEIAPLRESFDKAEHEASILRVRLLGPWVIKGIRKMPSATIYTRDACHDNYGEHWWKRRGWLRVVGGDTLRWEFDHNGKKSVFDMWDPSNPARFDELLIECERILGEDGFIITESADAKRN